MEELAEAGPAAPAPPAEEAQAAPPSQPQPQPEEPPKLPEPLVILKAPRSGGGESTFYVLGTAHVSAASCEDAAVLIRAVAPQVVLLELCMERKALLQMKDVKEPKLSEVLAEVRSGRSTPFQACYSWLLARVGRHLEVAPGEEFRVALREAHALGANVVLGDRPVTVTLARVWGALRLWEKLKLTGMLLWTGLTLFDGSSLKKEIESLKDCDVLTEAILEFGAEFPSLLRPLMTERDMYMVYMLRRLAEHADRVVAVVGAGHLPGIRAHWEEHIDIEAIVEMPAERQRSRWRWRRLALLAAGGLVVGSAVARYRGRAR